MPATAPSGVPLSRGAGAPAPGRRSRAGGSGPRREGRTEPRRVGGLSFLTRLLLVALALAGAVVLSLAVGSRTLPPAEIWDALLRGGDGTTAQVIREMRLPRTLVGLLAGAALGVAGAVLQGLTRNPIAEPGILGLAQGASAAVVIAIAFLGVQTLLGWIWFAFAGAGVAAVAVYAIASRGRGGASPVKLALAGAAINALLASLIAGVLTTRSATLDQFRFWQIGSLTGRDAEVLARLWPFLVIGLILVLASSRGLDALALGEDVARGLGRNVAAVRICGGLGAAVLTGTAVAAAGPIAFVGLAVPHLARALSGPSHRRLLPLAALLGPVVLLVADVVGRIVLPPSEVPAGVMTALIGVPFLIALVRRSGVGS
ncbi:FecCD family ABC transporter permease [Streptomyces alkaliphilus]|uniref:FecCD family ABC transporter permease n=1 Tax=Streptomyces alkaliphilus TaxID=1472722 RepID=UPI00117C018A|nr:iron ABC transporter permease [Streptomyces alkaliphilus]MQS09461.1 iron chelate uptake ABC transporter family permease subunit [Streptomyces alkaliphilus]